MKRWLKRIGIVILLTLSAFFIADRWIVYTGLQQQYDEVQKMPNAEAIVVLGARVYAGEVSAILAERLDAGIEAHQAQKTPIIVVSGDYSSRYYDEAAAMSTYLKRNGVEEKAILLDHAGFSTYDSIFRAKNVFGFNSIIIVTQDFHLPRALFIARHLDIQATGYNASRRKLSFGLFFHHSWREPLARIKAVYDVIRNAEPAYSGSGLPINAQGEVQRR